MTKSISIVIPTYNEAGGIGRLVAHLLRTASGPPPEVIVSDGGSTDQTPEIARAAGAMVVLSPAKGRAAQMNAGAAVATGEILYFLHADTFPPADYREQIAENCSPECGAGCFRLQFDEAHWFLQLNAWFTRFDVDSIRFGDQSLYILGRYFRQINGFREELLLLEDQEIIPRIRKVTGFRVLPAAVTTSARKYRENGIYRLQFIFFVIWLLYFLELPQQKLVYIYNRLIKRPNLKADTAR